MEGDVSLHLRERTWGALRCRRTIPAPISWRSLYFAFEHLAERRPGRLRGIEAARRRAPGPRWWAGTVPRCAPIRSNRMSSMRSPGAVVATPPITRRVSGEGSQPVRPVATGFNGDRGHAMLGVKGQLRLVASCPAFEPGW